MADNKITGSKTTSAHSPQRECPSGENRFAATVDKIRADNQLSRKEISAAIACQYGEYLPPATKRGGQPMSMAEMEKAGLIGALSKNLESAADDDVIALYRYKALGEENPSKTSDAKMTKQEAISYFKNLEAERIKHIQKRDLTETFMFFVSNKTITPNAPASREHIVKQMADLLSKDNPGATNVYDGTAVVATGPIMGYSMVHEAIHQHSHENILKLPSPLREGMTQFLTMDLLKKSGNLHGFSPRQGVIHPMETMAAYDLRGVVGEEALKNAYFKGDIEGLKTAYESKIGPGSWKKYVETFGRNEAFTFEKFAKAKSMIGNPGVQKSAHESLAELRTVYKEAETLEPIRGKAE